MLVIKSSGVEEKMDTKDLGNEDSEALITEEPRVNQEKENVNITNRVNVVSSTVNTGSNEVNAVGRKSSIELSDDQNMPELKDISISQYSNEEVFGTEADLNNLESTFQMDVKSAFLYGKIKEEVHVCQPPRFEDPDFPKKLYKVEKALYGLHQAPRAWKGMYTKIEKMMHKKFQISSIGELTYFLGLQVKQKEDGIFISQDNDYAGASLDRKSTTGVYTSCIEQFWTTAQAKNINGEAQIHVKVDGKKVIISEASFRRDLRFGHEGGVDCFSNEVIFEQLTLMGYEKLTQKLTFISMVKHLDSVNKFMMYPRFVQVFLDKQVEGMSKHNAIYVIPSYTKKVFGNMKRVEKGFSGKDTPLFLTMLVQAQADMVEDEALNEENVSTQSNDPPLLRVNTLGSGEDRLKLKELMGLCTKLSDRVLNLETTKTAQAKENSSLKKIVKRLEKKKRSGTHGLKRLYKGEFNTDFHPMVDFIAASPLRIETTDEGTYILATVDGIQRTVSEASLRRNLKLRDEDGIISIPDTELFENLTLMGYNISQNQKFTFQKGQFSHQWKYLRHTIMQCLSPKSTGFNEFSSNIATALVCLATNRTYNFSKMIFDGMVKNVNNKVSKFLILKLKELMELYTKLSDRVLNIETTKTAQEKEITNLKKKVKRLERNRKSISHGLKRLYKGRINDEEMFDTNVLNDEEVVVEDVNAASIATAVTIAATTVDSIDDITLAQALVEIKRSKPKARGIIMQELSETPTTTTIPISLKVQDKGKDADYELAARLQEEEQRELTIEEKSLLFVELMDKRKKYLAKLRIEEKRRKPLTKAQKRNQMCVYLKNMAGFTHSQLKNKSFDEVQKAFDKTMSWINSFVPLDSEVVKDKEELTQEISLKRAGDELEQERSKKQKVEDDKVSEELKRCLEIILVNEDDVTIYATPLSIKTPIIDYKI
nr:ribonuclease H-like domain-containing protein [Tanacetum cinerariifolium]